MGMGLGGLRDGQGGLACCGSWGRKESDMTEQLNWNWKANTLVTTIESRNRTSVPTLRIPVCLSLSSRNRFTNEQVTIIVITFTSFLKMIWPPKCSPLDSIGFPLHTHTCTFEKIELLSLLFFFFFNFTSFLLKKRGLLTCSPLRSGLHRLCDSRCSLTCPSVLCFL